MDYMTHEERMELINQRIVETDKSLIMSKIDFSHLLEERGSVYVYFWYDDEHKIRRVKVGEACDL
jgi:hypothetical protein